MKTAIIQQNNKNNLETTNLPLAEVKQKSQNQIKQLLQKYNIEPSDLDQNLWGNEKTWQEHLEKLTDNKEILSFVHKMREAIINKINRAKNDNKQNYNKPSNFPLPLFFFLSIFSLIFLFGIIVIRKKKKKTSNTTKQ